MLITRLRKSSTAAYSRYLNMHGRSPLQMLINPTTQITRSNPQQISRHARAQSADPTGYFPTSRRAGVVWYLVCIDEGRLNTRRLPVNKACDSSRVVVGDVDISCAGWRGVRSG